VRRGVVPVAAFDLVVVDREVLQRVLVQEIVRAALDSGIPVLSEDGRAGLPDTLASRPRRRVRPLRAAVVLEPGATPPLAAAPEAHG
jgi:hypothetical protein